MQNIYTVIAYRANGIDTCRGCVMGSTDSDFSVGNYTKVEDVVNFVAHLRFNHKQNQEKDYALDDLEVHILRNGFGAEIASEYDENSYEATREASLEISKINALIDKKITLLTEQEVQRLKQAEIEKEKQRQQAELAAKIKKEKEDKLLYERLKAKFEPDPSEDLSL